MYVSKCYYMGKNVRYVMCKYVMYAAMACRSIAGMRSQSVILYA